MVNYEDDPDLPYAVQMEPTKGCNLRCDFCGINSIFGKERTYDYMTPETADVISQQLTWLPRVELAMRGEPTMNPDLPEIIAVIRRNQPRISILLTTNGFGLIKKHSVAELFDAGLNTIAFDDYENVNILPKVDIPVWVDVHHYPQERNMAPNKRWPHDSQQFIIMQDISAADAGTHSLLNNHAGAVGPRIPELKQRCIKPFREMSIRYNGDVPLCCNIWDERYITSNIHTKSIRDIWRSREFAVPRRFLYHRRRPVEPCLGCDNTGYRLGLLPDRKGKLVLPEPTKRDEIFWKNHLHSKK